MLAKIDTPYFEFKEIDTEGHETLQTISSADNFNRWMYETIRPFCKGRILELGSGTGNISKFFSNDGSEIMLSDIRSTYCDILTKKFSGQANVLGIKRIDLILPDFEAEYIELLGTFDTVFALNVVEHIEADTLAIANAKKLLKPSGTIIILVPAFQSLYNAFDKELFHFKRYTKRSLSELFSKNSLTVSKKFYFNALGILGWFISGNIMKNEIIPEYQLSFYNHIIPIAKFIDIISLRKLGLSVIGIGKK